jgi:hypothetical protein
MPEEDSYPNSGRYVAVVFFDLKSFRSALDALLEGGFDPAGISVLGEYDAVQDHFGGKIPDAAKIADRPDTPRESLDTQTAVHRAMTIIGETLAAIGVMGASAAAYAVGGPVGVAVGIGADTETTVEKTLDRFVETSLANRYKESLATGGLVAWVHVYDTDRQAKAEQILGKAGGHHVHAVDA